MEELENAIKAHLDDFSSKDTAFAAKYNLSGKTVKGCVKYIVSELQKVAQKERGSSSVYCMAPSREKVFGMAVHYFDEDSIKECTEEPKARVMVSTSANKPMRPDNTETTKAPTTKKQKDSDILEGQLSLFN